jgi:vancomycin permeability regulator SanA
MKNALLCSAIVIAAIVLLSEVAYWRAAQSEISSSAGSCVVLVLGYPARADGSPNPVQLFRVEAAVEIYRKHRCTRMILSGGPIKNRHVEAESMAALAAGSGVPSTEMTLERSARSTWENVGCSVPHTLAAERVLVVSDSLHARRAVRYACRQDPGLCGRYRPAGVQPPISLSWWRLAAAANELRVFIRDFLLYESGSAENAPPAVAVRRRRPMQV